MVLAHHEESRETLLKQLQASERERKEGTHQALLTVRGNPSHSLTCHSPRHQSCHHRALTATNFGQRFEEEPVSSHCIQDPWHGEHGAQEAA